jgi:hypothetical protein
MMNMARTDRLRLASIAAHVAAAADADRIVQLQAQWRDSCASLRGAARRRPPYQTPEGWSEHSGTVTFTI